MAQTAPIETLIDKPLFDPTYLNVEYFFQKILDFINPIISFFTNPHTWTVAGIISSCLTIFFLGIIIITVQMIFLFYYIIIFICFYNNIIHFPVFRIQN